MRELRFRVWHPKEKYFSYWGFIETGKDRFAGIPSSNEGGFTLQYVRENSQQFTGLLDKRGKEIYEGDVLKHYLYTECEPWTVKWVQTDYNAWFDFGYLPQLHTCEIIGNIYEKEAT